MSKAQIRLPRSVKRLFPAVESVVDATKPVEISVNRRDCKAAQKLNPSECALARAGRRELEADAVIIGMNTSYVIKGTKAYRFSTPESVRREIVSFDRHQDFAPGDYYLTPKAPASRLGASRGASKTNGGNKSARRKIHHSARVRMLAKGMEASNE